MTAEDRRATARALLATVPLLARAIDASMREVQERLSPAHFAMLSMLAQRSMTQAELGQWMQVGAPTVSATVDALERRGWLQRERSQADRRTVLVILTDAGAAALKEMDDQALAGLEAAIDRLNDDEQAALHAGLDLLNKIFATPAFEGGPPPADVLFMRHPTPFPPGFAPPGFPPADFPHPPPGPVFFNIKLGPPPTEPDDTI